MEKEFAPYELAVKLKELGFKRTCLAEYIDGIFYLSTSLNNKKQVLTTASAPLWQQAFDWFREKHYIDSAILPTSSTKYIYRLYEQQSKSKTQIYGEYMGKKYKTYEEARQACLEKLIELCKNLKL